MCFLPESGSERGMSKAADQSLRPGAAEPGTGHFVPAEDQTCVRSAPPGTVRCPHRCSHLTAAAGGEGGLVYAKVFSQNCAEGRIKPCGEIH